MGFPQLDAEGQGEELLFVLDEVYGPLEEGLQEPNGNVGPLDERLGREEVKEMVRVMGRMIEAQVKELAKKAGVSFVEL